MRIGDFSTSGLSDALVILGAAGIVIPAFARIRISPVIGFILIGILVGPSGLGAMAGALPWLNYVTISNARGDRALRRVRHHPPALLDRARAVVPAAVGDAAAGVRRRRRRTAAVSAALIGVGIHLAGHGWIAAFALGLALALSSTAVVLPLVGTASPVGALGLRDAAVRGSGAGADRLRARRARRRTRRAASRGCCSTLGLGALVVAAMLLLGRFVLPRLFAQAARTKSPELFLSVSLLVVIAASLATAAAGLSPIVGALVAGVLIAETEYQGEVEAMTAPFRGLGLGVFLITVGMSLDLGFILSAWPQLLTALVGVMLVKTVVTGAAAAARRQAARGRGRGEPADGLALGNHPDRARRRRRRPA